MRMRPNCCKEKNREGEVTRILSAVKAVRLYETVQFALFWSFYAGRNPQWRARIALRLPDSVEGRSLSPPRSPRSQTQFGNAIVPATLLRCFHVTGVTGSRTFLKQRGQDRISRINWIQKAGRMALVLNPVRRVNPVW